MSEEPKYPTILPEQDRVEIGPLEGPESPMDPVFLEWWKNNWENAESVPLESLMFRAVAYHAWCARDAKIQRLEADLGALRCSTLPAQNERRGKAIVAALKIAADWQFALGFGAYHKAWVIDQMVRVLTGDNYDAFVKRVKSGEDGPDTYKWDCGRKP
jgi:hypothetical protein